jgi:hypothetical protein
LVYATSATTLGVIADVATGNALISGGAGGDPSYGKIGLTTHITGTLAVGNGGTGATSLTGYLVGNGTSAFTATATIPTSALSGTISLTTQVSGTLGAGNGGTGISSYTVGDILYASGTTALSSLADVATGNALISGGVSNAPLWGKIGLTTHVSGTLLVANGGSGATTLTGYLKGNGTSAFTASATIPSGDITGAALTKADDTNVTLTLGGSPSTALLAATSITAGWSGQLAVSRGGTGNSTLTSGYLLKGNGVSPTSASVIYDDGTNVAIGTSTAANRLTVSATGLDITGGIAINGTSMQGIRLQNTLNDNSSLGLWFGTNNVHWAGISGQRTNFAGDWTTDLRFYTHEAALVDITYARERMRIAGSGSVTAYVDMRAPIFYDADNTAYYVDPAGTSVLNGIGAGTITATNFLATNAFYVNGTTYYLNSTGGGWYSNARIQSEVDMRAPIFYDFNNTAYYVDPASTSNLVGLTVANTITGSVSGTSGSISGFNNPTTAPTANTIVYRDSIGDIAAREIILSSGLSTATPTVLVSMFPTTNQMVRTTPAAVSAAIQGAATGTWSISVTGNAATATNLSTNRTNWSTNGTITAVVGQLAWKNYGNNHTIFDASNSSSPDGGAVNNTNAQVAWAGTYPTLMGWNGVNTYGVRVDSARVADSASAVDFNNLTNKAGGTGTYTTSGDFRAPIFYDSNNTGYYLDPASTSNLVGLTVANTISGNVNGSAGFVAGTNLGKTGSQGFFTTSSWTAADWANLPIGGCGMTIFNTPGQPAGNNYGFFMKLGNRDAGGPGWGGIWMDYSAGSLWYGNTVTSSSFASWYKTAAYGVNSGGNLYATIYYDNDNTAYYLDPTSRSILSNISIITGATECGIRFRGDALDFVGRYGGYMSLYNQSSGGEFKILDAGYFNFNQYAVNEASFRAPIFYKSTNTGFYLDPYGTSNVEMTCTGTWYFQSNRNTSSSGAPLQAFSTGSFGATMAFHRAGVFAVNMGLDSDNIFRIGGWSASNNLIQLDMSGNFTALTSSRSPIFYDSDNTGFYINPNSTSAVAGAILIGPNSSGKYTRIGGNGGATDVATLSSSNGNLHLDAESGFNIYLAWYNTSTVNVGGAIVANGNITAFSDIRVKDNVETIPSALDKLDQIRGVTYTRTDLADKERRYAGVIAQEIEQVLPEAVFENEEYKSVDYNATIGLLIQAVKELTDKVKALEEKE